LVENFVEKSNFLEDLLVVYVSHKEVSLEYIGRLNKLKNKVYEKIANARGVVVLSTCNRFEVYLDGVGKEVVENVTQLFREVGVYPRVLKGVDVVRRLLKISAGLESRIIGEPEILGQLKEAWHYARAIGRVSPLLNMLFQQAIITGRKVRNETGISQEGVGYPSAAVYLTTSKIGSLNNKCVAIYGAGKAGRGILRIVCSRYSPSKIILVSRDPSKAKDIVSTICPRAKLVSREESSKYGPFDVIFIATEDLENPEDIPSRAKIVVDISIPPIVKGRNVYNIYELDKIVKKIIEERKKWITKAEHLIELDLVDFVNRIKQRSVSRLLETIMEYAEKLAQLESSKYNNSNEVYRLLSSYSKKLLHPLIVSLRETVSYTQELGDLLVALEMLYSEKLKNVKIHVDLKEVVINAKPKTTL